MEKGIIGMGSGFGWVHVGFDIAMRNIVEVEVGWNSVVNATGQVEVFLYLNVQNLG